MNTSTDTIDIRELFIVLKKKQLLIIVLTSLLTILSIFYAFFIATPIYKVNAIIEIGMLDNKPIDDIQNIKQKLSYLYQVDMKGTKRSMPFVQSITVGKQSNTILSFVIYGHTNNTAIEYTQSLLKKIKVKYQEKTDAHIENQEEYIALIRSDIQENNLTLITLKEELFTYQNKIITLKNNDAALAAIYIMYIGQQKIELQKIKKHISKLKETYQEVKLSLSPVMIKPTQIVGEIAILDKPIKPKKILIIIITFMLSFIFSIFLALLINFIQKIKEER